MKKIKTSTLRTLTAFLFLLLTVAGLVWHTGWGTISSFGILDIAQICPLGALEVMIAEGTLIPRAVVALLVFLVAAVFLGRFFCGWVCPVPPVRRLLLGRRGNRTTEVHAKPAVLPKSKEALSENGSHAGTVSSAEPQEKSEAACSPSACRSCPGSAACASKSEASGAVKPEATPYVVLGGALASSAIFGFPVFCLVCPVGLTFALVIALWRLFEFNETSWSILFFAGFLILELFVLRKWCHKFCPLGALMSLFARANRFFKPTVTAGACVRETHGVDCRLCIDACPEGIDLHANPTPEQLARCTKCHACADACPNRAISFPMKPGVIPIAPEHVIATAPRVEAGRLAPEVRKTSFAEVAGCFTDSEALQASSRCMHCGLCVTVCPQEHEISQWMGRLTEKDPKGAAEILLGAGYLPEICGRVCPHERFCEKICSMGEETGAVTIADLERSVSELALRNGWKPRARRARYERRVAVVGSGPAGLACADVLARNGIRVTVFEKDAEAGGLLTFGIPNFKLDKSVVIRRRKLLEGLGVEFRLNCEVGKDIAFEDIQKTFDAVFVATGAPVSVPLGIPGEAGEGVLKAIDYLRAASNRVLGLENASAVTVKGRRVLVLGGGDTAVDCLRTAVREGAQSVTCIARRNESTLRAAPSEVRLAREEGVQFRFETQTVEVLRNASGQVRGVRVQNRAAGTEEILEADVVIAAYGFRNDRPEWLERAGVVFDGQNRAQSTAGSKIRLGGDAVRGPDLVARAVADGRKAGEAIADALGLLYEKREAA